MPVRASSKRKTKSHSRKSKHNKSMKGGKRRISKRSSKKTMRKIKGGAPPYKDNEFGKVAQDILAVKSFDDLKKIMTHATTLKAFVTNNRLAGEKINPIIQKISKANSIDEVNFNNIDPAYQGLFQTAKINIKRQPKA